MELGKQLKEARAGANLSQEELAKRIGVSRQTISNWENCRSYPDIGSLIKLSDLYGLSLDAMLKEDRGIPEHFEDLSKKRRHACQITLEVGVLMGLAGMLLAGQEFPVLAMILQILGTVLTYIAVIGHLRFFDHSRKEIRYGIGGLTIILLCTVMVSIWPELMRDWLFRIVHLGGVVLLWMSGVWGMFWKSPRVWVYVGLYLTLPMLIMGVKLKDAGAMNPVNPFMHDYCVAQVLYPGEGEADGVMVHMNSVLGVQYKLRMSHYAGDREEIGEFTYTEPIPGQTELGIWQRVPEEDPSQLYRVAVESDESVTLSYYEDEVLQYRWLLTPVDTCTGSVTTIGKTISMRPEWYPAGSPDPEPYFKLVSVVNKATLNLGDQGKAGDTLTLVEEYHHGDSVEITTHTLTRGKNGSFTLELETRYDGVAEYALYRIPYLDGEYRFTLTFGK